MFAADSENKPESFIEKEAEESGDESAKREGEEEEEEVAKDKNEYELNDGFLVEDHVEEPEEPVDDKDQEAERKKKKSRELEEDLDEEDLQLIEDATGLSLPRKEQSGQKIFQRLKKRRTDEDSTRNESFQEPLFDDEEGNNAKDFFG
jgi:transcription elongation factor SPT6